MFYSLVSGYRIRKNFVFYEIFFHAFIDIAGVKLKKLGRHCQNGAKCLLGGAKHPSMGIGQWNWKSSKLKDLGVIWKVILLWSNNVINTYF